MGKVKTKYIEETFKRWFVFGEYPDSDFVDISNGEEDVITKINLQEAKELISERDKIIDTIITLIGDDYEKFTILKDRYHG